MAGRYQGCHVLPDGEGGHRSIEVFWNQAGWFWRPIEGGPLEGAANGPFTTSTEAYQNARGRTCPSFTEAALNFDAAIGSGSWSRFGQCERSPPGGVGRCDWYSG